MDNPEPPAHTLVIMAHPDDLEYSAAGTVALWTASGTRVTLCLCTSGERGTAEELAGETVARARIQEQGTAARLLGIDEVIALGHQDGALQVGAPLLRDLTRVICAVRPDAVMCPDPTWRFDGSYINHPDHCVTGEAALRAVYPTAQNRPSVAALLGGEVEPHDVSRVFLSSPMRANCFVDISATIERKTSALLAHTTQTRQLDVRAAIVAEARRVGALAGLEYAEEFFLIDLTDTP